ncbi:hypothetical protein [Argonema antarcticum]|uniref:hypothetical protein n=1 Tax=Argonema antarcticum TaxID=2942763 RepID=UPI002010C9CE|nr:hypothetical protein [Argonema antarcticum]MCL1474676.1 hypothetical protein [Argonema antarcticum A004/B2]
MYYRSIPEYQEYLLIEQTEYHVMQYVKSSENQWILSEYSSVDDLLTLRSLNGEITLNQLYKKVNFAGSVE